MRTKLTSQIRRNSSLSEHCPCSDTGWSRNVSDSRLKNNKGLKWEAYQWITLHKNLYPGTMCLQLFFLYSFSILATTTETYFFSKFKARGDFVFPLRIYSADRSMSTLKWSSLNPFMCGTSWNPLFESLLQLWFPNFMWTDSHGSC